MDVKNVLSYLEHHKLIIATAESCTGGQIIHLLAKIPGSGACLDTGYVVYSISAKKKVLGVKQKTITRYNVTSEEVAIEMASGALKNSEAQVAVATTGLAGPGSKDGIPTGTICFAWVFFLNEETTYHSETKLFKGTRSQIVTKAAKYALSNIPKLHQSLIHRVKS